MEVEVRERREKKLDYEMKSRVRPPINDPKSGSWIASTLY